MNSNQLETGQTKYKSGATTFFQSNVGDAILTNLIKSDDGEYYVISEVKPIKLGTYILQHYKDEGYEHITEVYEKYRDKYNLKGIEEMYKVTGYMGTMSVFNPSPSRMIAFLEKNGWKEKKFQDDISTEDVMIKHGGRIVVPVKVTTTMDDFMSRLLECAVLIATTHGYTVKAFLEYVSNDYSEGLWSAL